MKTICTLVAGLMLAGNALAIEIPERFRDYKERATFKTTHPIQSGGNIYCMHKYDLTNPSDKKPDVAELYPAIPAPDGTLYHLSEYPIAYWFDKDGNNQVTPDEALIDEAADGINGNEYWQNQPKEELHPNQKGA